MIIYFLTFLGITICLYTFPLKCSDTNEENVDEGSEQFVRDNFSDNSLEKLDRFERNVPEGNLDHFSINLSNSGSTATFYSDDCDVINEIVQSINFNYSLYANEGIMNPDDTNLGIESVFYCSEGCFVINNLDCQHRHRSYI